MYKRQIYNNTTDLGELEFAQEVYKHGEVEVDSEKAEIIRKYMEVGRFFARIKKGVFDLLDSINTVSYTHLNTLNRFMQLEVL